MDELDAIGEIGFLSKTLAASSQPSGQANAAAGNQKDNKSPETSRPQSSAPAPISPVSGSAARSTVDPDKMSTAEYIRKRNEGSLR